MQKIPKKVKQDSVLPSLLLWPTVFGFSVDGLSVQTSNALAVSESKLQCDVFTKTGRIQVSPVSAVELKLYNTHKCLPGWPVLRSEGFVCLARPSTCLVCNRLGFPAVISSLLMPKAGSTPSMSFLTGVFLHVHKYFRDSSGSLLHFSEV